MTDAIDLHAATIVKSPADIADWPVTATITRLTMDPQGGLALSFAVPIQEAWKWPSNPAIPSDNFQFTVWAVVKINGQWLAAGFVQMWQGREMGNPGSHALPPILTGYPDWWGDVRRLWGPMADYVPRAGDQVGFLISAGNGRLQPGVTSVRERSNVVVVPLPVGDRGDFGFGTTVTVPAPPGVVVPPVVLPNPPSLPPGEESKAVLGLVLERLDNLTSQLTALDKRMSDVIEEMAGEQLRLEALLLRGYSGAARAGWPLGNVTFELTPKAPKATP
jgi:hypothetical protein